MRNGQNPYFQAEENINTINSIKEISEKLDEENDGKKKTKLMMEMMLRGLQLQCTGVPDRF